MTMKRITIFVLAFALMLSITATPAFAAIEPIFDPDKSLSLGAHGSLVVLAIDADTGEYLENAIFRAFYDGVFVAEGDMDGTQVLLAEGVYDILDAVGPPNYERQRNPETIRVVIEPAVVTEIHFIYSPVTSEDTAWVDPEFDGCCINGCAGFFNTGYSIGYSISTGYNLSESIGISAGISIGSLEGSEGYTSYSLPAPPVDEYMISGTYYFDGVFWVGTQVVSIYADCTVAISEDYYEYDDGTITQSRSITYYYYPLGKCVYSVTESTSITTGAGGSWMASSMSSGTSVTCKDWCECPD